MYTVKNIIRASRDSISWTRDVASATNLSIYESFYRLFKIQLTQNIDAINAVLSGMHFALPSEWPDYVSWRQLSKFRELHYSQEDLDTLDDKVKTSNHLLKNGINTPEIICIFNRKNKTNIGEQLFIDNLDEFVNFLNSDQTPDSYILKPAVGQSGLGIFVLDKNKGVKTALGNDISIDEMCLFILEENKRNNETGYIVQPMLRCHADVENLTKSRSLSTTRVVTLNKNGNSSIFFAAMKLISRDQYVDNFHYGDYGNLISPIDIASGTMNGLVGVFDAKFSRASTWGDTHPRSLIRFNNINVPQWEEIHELAIRVARLFPNAITIGLDIASTPSGPTIVDTNAFWGVDMIQLSHRRGIKKDLRDIAPSCF